VEPRRAAVAAQILSGAAFSQTWSDDATPESETIYDAAVQISMWVPYDAKRLRRKSSSSSVRS
jgi:hypothetical protein